MRWVRQWFVVAGLLLGPLAVLVFLRTFTQFDLGWFSAEAHLVAVSAISLIALAAASAASVTAMRSRQPNVIWLGIGCVAVGSGMLGHGLTTPGVLGQPDNVWVIRLPYLAMCAFAASLAAAGRSPSAVTTVVGGSRPPLGLSGLFSWWDDETCAGASPQRR